MEEYLLDADVVIEWLKQRPRVIETIADLIGRGVTLAVNAITITEVYSGLFDDEMSRAERLFASLPYWPIEPQVAVQAGLYRNEYSRRGRQLAVPDMLLAAHAKARDATLFTGDVSDFPMPGLKILRMK